MRRPIASLHNRHMTSLYWPLTGLRVRTPRLELRWPSLEDLDTLAALAAEGVHDPDVQPFTVAWTDAEPADRARGLMQYHWRMWGSWQPADWAFDLAVVHGGEVVGVQGLTGHDFAVRREVSTGSWLGRKHQGQGIGTEMRSAVLHLAFEGLAAEYATSGAYEDNAASLAVSRKLGYADDGIERHAVRGQAATLRRLRIDRAAWRARQSLAVEIEGLAECLPCFGLTP
jgi:RimJ/RimL family protein N-acetyltransferase